MSVSENQEVYEVSLRGGLRPSEAEKLADLEQSVLEEGEYRPSDIPALGAEIETSQGRDESLPAQDMEKYVNKLLQDPGSMIPKWSFDGGNYPFENLASTVREKRDEYTLRTVYAFEDSLDQEFIDETVGTIVNKSDYRHETAINSADGHLGVLIGKYINEINELVEDDEIITQAYRKIEDTPESSVMAAANQPIKSLPYSIRQNIFDGKDLSSDRITTRLRKMQGAGRCGDLEERHQKVLFGEEPTRNNTLISLDGELIGSLKYEGDTSMLALQDVKKDGRQVLQKGMAYRVSHPMIEEIQPERIEDEQETYQDWEIKEPEILEVRPLRFARDEQSQSIQGFRDKIDDQRQELTDHLKRI